MPAGVPNGCAFCVTMQCCAKTSLKKRGWKSETLRQLALELYLGYDDEKKAIALFTIPASNFVGVRKGSEFIRWAFGKPWLWRGAYLNFCADSEIASVSLR